MNEQPDAGADATHVLLVDDDQDVRRALRRVLERLGFRVTEAGNGHDALASQARDPAQVLLTDIVMPGKEGTETIMEFRRSHPAVRIIAMSGGGIGSAGSYLRVAKAMGAAVVLEKPFSNDDLAAAIRG